jgi:hypothetical protein
LSKQHEEGTISKLELAIHVVDIDSPALSLLADPPHNLSKEEVLARVQEFVDRTLDLGGASKFKRVEDFFIKWHPPDDDHPAALGIYINVRLRNGDEEDQFLPHAGTSTMRSTSCRRTRTWRWPPVPASIATCRRTCFRGLRSRTRPG